MADRFVVDDAVPPADDGDGAGDLAVVHELLHPLADRGEPGRVGGLRGGRRDGDQGDCQRGRGEEATTHGRNSTT